MVLDGDWFRAVVLNLGSVSQSQGFGGGQDTHPTHMIRDDTPRFAVNIHYYVFVFLCENHVLMVLFFKH